jgi:hypothetical protein
MDLYIKVTPTPDGRFDRTAVSHTFATSRPIPNNEIRYIT